ncbi:hypothetical protein EB796_006437 [Bugula neritina]|uniref:Uncharacterized protein n=1 Tax=Bugula neritina TaxID=10212 RepID=A0A7J7KBE2_BUGNE|nr:hypothetical protein EB796_006437 [Bugula neritina]
MSQRVLERPPFASHNPSAVPNLAASARSYAALQAYNSSLMMVPQQLPYSGVTGPSGYPSLTVNNSNVNQQNHINALYNQKQ